MEYLFFMAKVLIMSLLVRDSRLNHLLLILSYIEEFDEINIKILINKLIKEKESRVATLGLYQF